MNIGCDDASCGCIKANILTQLKVFSDFDDLRFHRVVNVVFAILQGERCGVIDRI